MTDNIAKGFGLAINDILPHKVCINLDRNPDRWTRMRARFERHRIEGVHRVTAVDGNKSLPPSKWPHSPGAYGCLLSHLLVVRESRRRGLPSILIFEDDVVFDADFCEKFSDYVSDLPGDWDMLFLGALHMDDPLQMSGNVYQTTAAYATYAYALKNSVFDNFIALHEKKETAVDVNNVLLQRESNSYCFMPQLAWVETTHSEILGQIRNHWYLKESAVLHGCKMKQLLDGTQIVIAHPSHLKPDNVSFLTHFYAKHLPGTALIVVEQNTEPTIGPASLPTGCEYVLVKDTDSFNRRLCFEKGVRSSAPAKAYFMLCDSDICIEPQDFRGNLRMCERYDCTTGFINILDLTPEQNSELHEFNTVRSFDLTSYTTSTNGHSSSYCRFFRREVLENGIPDHSATRDTNQSSLLEENGFSVFCSPNHALRLPQ